MLQSIVNFIAVILIALSVISMVGITVIYKLNNLKMLTTIYKDVSSKKYLWLYLATMLVVGVMATYFMSNYVITLISVIAVGLIYEMVFVNIMKKKLANYIANSIKSGNVGYSDLKIW